MNNQFISPLQVTSAKSWSGMTEYNSLSNIFATQPHELGAIMSSHFGYEYGQYINLLTGGLGNTIIVTSDEYRWDLHGQNARAIEVLSTPETTATPGIQGSVIRVVFAEQFFSHSDNLISDDGTQVRVTGDPEPRDGGWMYRLELTAGIGSNFIDPTQIASGARFSKMYSTVGEYSKKGGSTSYTAPMKIRNKLTTLRKEFSMTGTAAATEIKRIKLKSPDGKKEFDMWAPYAQLVAMQQFYAEIDKSLVYSQYTGNADDTIKDENGRPVIQGAGLRQQIAPANVRYYTSLSYNFLMDFFTDLSFVASPMGGNNKFVMLTGSKGMIEFDRAINAEFVTRNITITNEGRFVTGSGMNLTFGSQFKTVVFPGNIEVTVVNFPPYDDIVMHRTKHPVSKAPIESYRFTIINIGKDGEGKSNIQKVVRQDREMLLWSEGGSISIDGKGSKSLSNQASNSLDGAVGHMLSECGLRIGDPTKCGELIFNID